MVFIKTKNIFLNCHKNCASDFHRDEYLLEDISNYPGAKAH